MRLENWEDTAAVTYDRATLDEPVSLRFVEVGHNALILGAVGVGKTFLATALGTQPSVGDTASISSALTGSSSGSRPRVFRLRCRQE